MNSERPPMLGVANTGLIGPYAFPFAWTFQRRGEHQRSARRRARHLAGHPASVPLFIEAVAPPLKALRHLLRQLAEVVDWHARWHVGFEGLRALFPGPDGTIVVDFADQGRIDACPRDGTRMLFGRRSHWFRQRYAELQRRALANGRYFPPPAMLRVKLAPDGSMRVDLGFAHGFLPGDRLYVFLPFSPSSQSSAWLLAPGESVPLHVNMRDFLHACAERYARPGETLLGLGRLWPDAKATPDVLCEGAELTATIEGETYFDIALFWRGQRIGWSEQADLRELIRRRIPLRIRVVRKYFLHHPVYRIAFALYCLPGHVIESTPTYRGIHHDEQR